MPNTIFLWKKKKFVFTTYTVKATLCQSFGNKGDLVRSVNMNWQFFQWSSNASLKVVPYSFKDYVLHTARYWGVRKIHKASAFNFHRLLLVINPICHLREERNSKQTGQLQARRESTQDRKLLNNQRRPLRYIEALKRQKQNKTKRPNHTQQLAKSNPGLEKWKGPKMQTDTLCLKNTVRQCRYIYRTVDQVLECDVNFVGHCILKNKVK